MQVTRMTCPSCEVSVEADFPAPRLARLPVEHQRFIEMFVLASGNLKAIAEQAGVSYPTVRSRLDKIIDSLHGQLLALPDETVVVPATFFTEVFDPVAAFLAALTFLATAFLATPFFAITALGTGVAATSPIRNFVRSRTFAIQAGGRA